MARLNPAPRDVFVGELRQQYTLTLEEDWIKDAPGGNVLYAAAGYMVWEKDHQPGLSARVGENYPQYWLENISQKNINVDGVVVLSRAIDLRSCVIYDDGLDGFVDDPVPYLTQHHLSLPQGLIGYDSQTLMPAGRRASKPTAIREGDIPKSYRTATGAHLCPLDYLSHNLLPAVFRQQGYSTITLDPGSLYMDPSHMGDIPALVTGLTAFLPNQEDLINLYKGRTTDLWEIAEDIGRYGCELVVIKRGISGSLLYDSTTGKKWDIRSYPARVKNTFGAGDAFCGGFLAGYRQTFDPLQAVLFGSVALSLMIEGYSPFYCLEAISGLADARLDYLQGMVREV
jgi:sugar/nucleoside kinase (ribokinase family)